MPRVDLQNLKSKLKKLSIEGVSFANDKNKSTQTFSFEVATAVQYATTVKMLVLVYFYKQKWESVKSKERTLSNENKKELKDRLKKVQDDFRSILGEVESLKNIVQIVLSEFQTAISWIELSISDFFSLNEDFAFNTHNDGHAAAFNVKKGNQIPMNAITIKLKGFSNDNLHVRIGITHKGVTEFTIHNIVLK